MAPRDWVHWDIAETLISSEEQDALKRRKELPVDQKALSRVCCLSKSLYEAWKQAQPAIMYSLRGKNPLSMSTSKLAFNVLLQCY